jgi:predicted ATPase
MSLCFEVLEHLGFKMKSGHIRFCLAKEIIKFIYIFKSNKKHNLKPGPKANDKIRFQIENTMMRMVAIANLENEELFAFLIVKLCNLSIEWGCSEFSAPAYASCSFVLNSYIGSSEKAFKLAKVAENILEDSDNAMIHCMTRFIFGSFIIHWEDSADESIKHLTKAVEIGVKGGEFQYAGYAFLVAIEMRYIMGTPIDELTIYSSELAEDPSLYIIALPSENMQKDCMAQINYYLDNRFTSYLDYNPEAANMIDNKIEVIYGDYLIYIISNDNETAFKNLTE